MNKKEIAAQSRQWLINSLLELMSIKDYHKITIVDIAINADLARRTFYRNFNTKEEVLEAYMHQLCDEYIAYLSNTILSFENIGFAFFSFWQKHIDFLRTLKENHMLYFLLEMFNEYLPSTYQFYKGDKAEYDNDIEKSYALLFSAGGFWNVLVGWLNSETTLSPQEMSKIVTKALNSFVKEVE